MKKYTFDLNHFTTADLIAVQQAAANNDLAALLIVIEGFIDGGVLTRHVSEFIPVCMQFWAEVERNINKANDDDVPDAMRLINKTFKNGLDGLAA